MLPLEVKLDCSGVDWRAVSETLETVGMASHAPDQHRRAFEASHTVVFVYHEGRLIGFGRAISDGIYQAAVYDCAVLPDYQGRGIGKLIVEKIRSRLSHCNLILYASPGKEGFYRKLGFRGMKTGMARFRRGESMRARGFTD
jgi:GNAT superfamily N-acetyltransferase